MSMILALLFLFLSLHSCNAARLINAPTKEFLHYSITKELNEEKVHGGVGRRVLREKSESVNEVVKDSANLKKKIFRVPQKKRGDHNEEAPGFNLDYLPPKTHPPSHN